jgi:hypothetical protein
VVAVGDGQAVAADVRPFEVEVEVLDAAKGLRPVATQRGLPGHDVDGLSRHEGDAQGGEDDVVRVVRQDRVEVAGVPEGDPLGGEPVGEGAIDHGSDPSPHPSARDVALARARGTLACPEEAAGAAVAREARRVERLPGHGSPVALSGRAAVACRSRLAVARIPSAT